MANSPQLGGSAGAPAGQGPTGRDPREVSAGREGRRWRNFRRAVREARAAGAFAIRANGIKVWLRQPQPTQPQSKSKEDEAAQQGERQESRPTARKRRSAQRLQEFLQRKRLQQLAGCRLQLTLLRAMKLLRWRRTQEVWTAWMRANRRAAPEVPMLLEPSGPSAPSSAPQTNKRTAEERSPGKLGPASGATQPTSPTSAGGKQPRSLTYSAAAGGGSGAPPIDFKLMKVSELKTELMRRGLETTGLKRELLARLEAPPPTHPALT